MRRRTHERIVAQLQADLADALWRAEARNTTGPNHIACAILDAAGIDKTTVCRLVLTSEVGQPEVIEVTVVSPTQEMPTITRFTVEPPPPA